MEPANFNMPQENHARLTPIALEMFLATQELVVSLLVLHAISPMQLNALVYLSAGLSILHSYNAQL